MFKVGDKVRIKPEWCKTPEDAERVHTVTNVNDITKRCYITMMLPGFVIPTSNLVAFYMIEKAE